MKLQCLPKIRPMISKTDTYNTLSKMSVFVAALKY